MCPVCGACTENTIIKNTMRQHQRRQHIICIVHIWSRGDIKPTIKFCAIQIYHWERRAIDIQSILSQSQSIIFCWFTMDFSKITKRYLERQAIHIRNEKQFLHNVKAKCSTCQPLIPAKSRPRKLQWSSLATSRAASITIVITMSNKLIETNNLVQISTAAEFLLHRLYS